MKPGELQAEYEQSFQSTTHNKAAQERLLSILCALREDSPTRVDAGLCWQVGETLAAESDGFYFAVTEELRGVFEALGLDREYPVEHPTLANHRAYTDTDDLWDRSTEYGQNRWKLLDQCIAYLEAA